MSMLQAMQQLSQQQQQPQSYHALPSLNFSVGGGSDLLSRNNSLGSPPVVPPAFPHTSASPTQASLFGDDAIFAGLLSARIDSRAEAAPYSGASTSEGFLPCEFAQPPLDWSLHSRLRFTSPHPLPPPRLTPQEEAEALQAFVLRSASSIPSTPLTPAVAFASSLFFYIHPSSPLNDRHPLTPHLLDAQVSVAPTPSDRRCLAYSAQRWAEWEQSFRSLYYQLRHRHLHHFYLVSSSYTALFLASPSTHSNPAAVLSRSTAALRATLTSLGVKYTAPYAKVVDPAPPPPDDTAVGRLPRGVRLVGASEKREEDGLLPSLLVVRGKDEVHGLFDALINERKGEDVPTLLSSRPFQHGCLQSLAVSGGGKGGGWGGRVQCGCEGVGAARGGDGHDGGDAGREGGSVGCEAVGGGGGRRDVVQPELCDEHRGDGPAGVGRPAVRRPVSRRAGARGAAAECGQQ